MLFFYIFYSSKNPEEKMYHVSNILNSTTVFNVDNKKKCLLSNKSAHLILEGSSRDLKTGIMMLKHAALHHRNKYIQTQMCSFIL